MYKNTLLIDDDPNTLYLHRHFLSHYSFYENLIEFQDPYKALTSFQTTHNNYKNLILLDLNMPQMLGWEFVEKLSSSLNSTQLENTTIVIVSSSCNPRDITRANNHPNICAFIEKPFLPDDIEQLLNKLKTKFTQQEIKETGLRQQVTI